MKSVMTVTIHLYGDDAKQVAVKVSQAVTHSPRFDDIQDWSTADRLTHDAITAYQMAIRTFATAHPDEYSASVKA